MKQSHWRVAAQQVITKVINENPNASIEELRKLVSAAYPWHPRENHPYKIWLDEVKRLLPYEGKRLVTKDDVRNMWVK